MLIPIAIVAAAGWWLLSRPKSNTGCAVVDEWLFAWGVEANLTIGKGKTNVIPSWAELKKMEPTIPNSVVIVTPDNKFWTFDFSKKPPAPRGRPDLQSAYCAWQRKQ